MIKHLLTMNDVHHFYWMNSIYVKRNIFVYNIQIENIILFELLCHDKNIDRQMDGRCDYYRALLFHAGL